MPSFDIVSNVAKHELANAVDQANREITTRFDFKDSGATFTLEEDNIIMKAPSEFQLQQMKDILQSKISKRSIDLKSLSFGTLETSLHEARQKVEIKQGIDAEKGKEIVKIIKTSKLKVQAAIQGDQIRVTGKKRDDLQEAITTLKQAEVGLPLQYTNFRD